MLVRRTGAGEALEVAPELEPVFGHEMVHAKLLVATLKRAAGRAAVPRPARAGRLVPAEQTARHHCAAVVALYAKPEAVEVKDYSGTCKGKCI